MIHVINRWAIAALLVVCCFALVLPFQLSAQENLEIPAEIQALIAKDPTTLTEEEKTKISPFLTDSSQTDPQVDTLENTVNCFDYYRFGSVQVDLSATLEQTVPGVPLTFSGQLKNENPYPVVNGSVYVKIFKVGEDNFEHRNGYPLVAFFEAGKDLQLSASSTKQFTFDWQVPQSLAGGDYEAAFFFVTDHRFNLLGLTFTDDVTGNKASFHVTTENEDQVVFDKHAVTLNDDSYSFAAFPPHFNLDTPVVLTAPIINPSKHTKTVTLTWQLYNWDGLRSDFLLDTKIETVTLKAGETKPVSYATIKQIGTVTYIIATLTDGDATSILNPRFARDNIEEVRLNFPSLTKFPINKGEENTLFSCVHSTNLPLVHGNELTMSLTDTNSGETIHAYTYQGGVTGAMMGVAEKFIPQDSYGQVTLTTTLRNNGQIIDTVSQSYDCRNLSPGECPLSEEPLATRTTGGSSFLTTLIISIFLVILVFFVSVQMIKRRRTQQTVTNNSKIIF
jgi:hypothetical protein